MDQAQIDLKEQARKLFEKARTDPSDIETIYKGAASYPTIDIPADLKEVEVIVKEGTEAPLSKKEVAAIKAAIPTLELLIAQRDAAHEKNRAEYLRSSHEEMAKRFAALEMLVDESKREAALAREAVSAAQSAQAAREAPLFSAMPTAEQMSIGSRGPRWMLDEWPKCLPGHFKKKERRLNKNHGTSQVKSSV